MKALTKPVAIVTSVAAAVAVVTVAHSAMADRIGSYDFSYDISGDARVKPIQVFDNGKSTYFQFRSGEPIPAIFTMTASGPVLVMPEPQGPYFKVDTVAGGYVLRMGYGVGQVKYSGAERAALLAHHLPPPTPTEAAQARSTQRLLAATQQINGLPSDMFSAPPPPVRLEVNSYATPVKGDRTEWVRPPEPPYEMGLTFTLDSSRLLPSELKALRAAMPKFQRAARIEIEGRDDPSHREGTAADRADAVADVLVAAGVPRSVIAVKTTVRTKSLGGKKVEGVTIKVFEKPRAEPVQPAIAAGASEVTVADVARRLQAGQITPSEAAALLAQARQAPARTVAGATAAAPAAWWMRKTDENVHRMLQRWGRDAGWTVVWEGAPAIPITGDAPVDRPDFIQAADLVVKQAKRAGYRLRATAYSNNVLEIAAE